MKLLLDTSSLLWFLNEGERFSKKAKRLVEDEENELYVSIASYWEICIKQSLGKLMLEKNGLEAIKEEMSESNILWLPISVKHCELLISLPFFHGDPFDRILIAQAKAEGMSILTSDKQIKKYDVNSLW